MLVALKSVRSFCLSPLVVEEYPRHTKQRSVLPLADGEYVLLCFLAVVPTDICLRFWYPFVLKRIATRMERLRPGS